MVVMTLRATLDGNVGPLMLGKDNSCVAVGMPTIGQCCVVNQPKGHHRKETKLPN